MVIVKYFGQIADLTNCTSETFEVPRNGFSELIQQIIQRYQLDISSIVFALNHELVHTPESVSLSVNDEVAVFPPFAGG